MSSAQLPSFEAFIRDLLGLTSSSGPTTEAFDALVDLRWVHFVPDDMPDSNVRSVCQMMRATTHELTVEWDGASREFLRHVIDFITNGPHIERLHFTGVPAIDTYGPNLLQKAITFGFKPMFDCDYAALEHVLRTLNPKRLENIVFDQFYGSGDFLSVLPNSLRLICLSSVHGLDMQHVYRLCARCPHLLDLVVYKHDISHEAPTDMADLVASCSGTSLRSLRLAIGPLSNLAELAKLKRLTELQLTVDGGITVEFERFAEAVDGDFPLVQLDMECEEFTPRMAKALLRFRQLRSLQLECWNKMTGLQYLFDCISVVKHPTLTELLVFGWQQHACPSALRFCRQLETLQFKAVVSEQILDLATMAALRSLCLGLRVRKSEKPATEAKYKKRAIKQINELLRHLAVANKLEKLWLQLPLRKFDMVLENVTLQAMRGFTSLRDLHIQGSLKCPQIVGLLKACPRLLEFGNSGCSAEAMQAVSANLFTPIRPKVCKNFSMELVDLSLR